MRQAHRKMTDVDFDLPDRKNPPSNAVARAMNSHFNPIQPPEPDKLPPPNFDTDNASMPSDAFLLALLLHRTNLIPGPAYLALVV
jgi:hypothetical protein